MQTKQCRKCGENKPLEAFAKRTDRKNGRQSYCRVCKNALNVEWRRNNKQKNRASTAKWKANATPCVYRIKNKVSGLYYLGQTTQRLCERTQKHFSPNSHLQSPFTGLNKEEWECEVLCYGTKKQVRELEKVLLNTRVDIDPLCMNKNTW